MRPEADAPRPRPGWGGVLNYDLSSTFASLQNPGRIAVSGSVLTLDGRVFSPFGTIEQSGMVRTGGLQPTQVVRLDSFYRYSDPDRLMSWTAGDTVSGGLSWSRPIRIGGLQVQSNFALRPDLVTMPLPNLGGSAAVPSTVDVFVNNTRLFSQEVGAGPFNLMNIPVVTGAGNAQMVVRDASGRETVTNLPFYGSASLLAPGLSAWSLEAGLPRVSYSAASDFYPMQPVASATWRQGISEWLTLESHAEGARTLANGGVGAAFGIWHIGVATAAVAASRSVNGRGGLGSLSFETSIHGISLSVSSQRTAGTYDDLASVTAQGQGLAFLPVSYPGYFPVLQHVSPIYTDSRTPLALDRVTLGGTLGFGIDTSWGLNFVNRRDRAGNSSRLVSVSVSRALPFDASLFATAFRDFGTRPSTGVLIGISVPLGRSASVSSNVSTGSGGFSPGISASQALAQEPGSIGWRVRDAEGAVPYRDAAVSYRAGMMTAEVGVNETRQGVGGSFTASGAIAAMGGGVFAANRINDAFAVVDTGMPGVLVSSENRPVGTSDSSGLLLVPSLRSYERNRLSIDPSALPVDTEVETTRELATPADRTGIVVSFRVRADASAALVTFVLPGGGFVPAGSVGRMDGGAEFIVGYDGQAFIKGLQPSNRAAIDLGDALCAAHFAFHERPGEQVRIGPVACAPAAAQ